MAIKRERVVIVGGMRTPFVKAGAQFSDLDQLDLSAHAVAGLLERYPVNHEDIGYLVWGRVLHDPRISNLAREIVFRLKLPETIHALLVSNNCITSLHALVDAAEAIRSGRTSVAIAGGVESMSTVPILFGHEASEIFRRLGFARTAGERMRQLLCLRPGHFKPRTLGFKEPSTGLTMGEHAEISAKEWQVGRNEQDEIALRSHHRAAQATADGRLKLEINPLKGVDHDTIVREDTSMVKLAKLPPVFDRSDTGTITAGNASPLTDGAAALLVMSESYAHENGFEPLAVLGEVEFAAIDPGEGLLMAPAVAVPRLLRKSGLALGDMDIVEIHEAFGAQVVCNLKAWRDGWKEAAIGEVEVDRLNPLGSSISVGHPFGATGARIVTTLANEMHRRQSAHGLVSVCAAGAMAAALLLHKP